MGFTLAACRNLSAPPTYGVNVHAKTLKSWTKRIMVRVLSVLESKAQVMQCLARFYTLLRCYSTIYFVDVQNSPFIFTAENLGRVSGTILLIPYCRDVYIDKPIPPSSPPPPTHAHMHRTLNPSSFPLEQAAALSRIAGKNWNPSPDMIFSAAQAGDATLVRDAVILDSKCCVKIQQL
jgi:hypothetical protein